MSTEYSTAFDVLIKDANEAYLSTWDWRWLKAQLIAESALDPAAVSAAGAQGLAQFMPGTWSDVTASMHLPSLASPFDPVAAIQAAAWYMAKIRSWWAQYRSEDDRRRLAQASYNAGIGSMLRARDLAHAIDYDKIIGYLAAVTGPINSGQTIAYVKRIAAIYSQLTAQEAAA